MPMIAPEAAQSSPGLSARARDLWQASLLYRRLADALAADGIAKSSPMPVETPETAALVASTADLE